MLGLDTAEREGWWSGYDWVVRLNPDVIIRDDAFLRTQMARDDVDAIFANCRTWRPRDVLVMTDFTAWRPKAVRMGAFRLPAGHTTDCGGRDAWIKVQKCNSEKSATAAFRQVLASGRYALLPNAKGPSGHCRVDGRFSSVVHAHDYADRCRADLARRSYALPTPTRDPAAARCYAKRYQDVERKLCPSGRYQPSCAEKMRGHYVAHGAEEGRVYGCSGERDSFKPTA